jgi:hypothetical protein
MSYYLFLDGIYIHRLISQTPPEAEKEAQTAVEILERQKHWTPGLAIPRIVKHEKPIQAHSRGILVDGAYTILEEVSDAGL